MDQKTINYVRLEFDTETIDRLYGYCREHKLGLFDGAGENAVAAADFKFHLTVIYSSVAHPNFVEGEYDIRPLEMQPEELRMFGPNNEIAAIKLKKNPGFANLFDHYRTTYGHVSDYPLNPHVSIRGSNAGYAARLPAIPMPDFPLIANRLIHQIKQA